MSRRALLLYFGGLAVLVLASALFAFRPTPLTGFDGGDLAESLNSSFSSSTSPCKHRGEGWSCQVWDNSTSGTVTYEVDNPDWWGCWSATRQPAQGYSSTPRALSGCITLLDHT